MSLGGPWPGYVRWIRERFPELNRQADAADNDALAALIDESLIAVREMTTGTGREIVGGAREEFTYLTMVHSALWRHVRQAESLGQDTTGIQAVLSEIEGPLVAQARTIGVESRFLSSFYLLHNPEVNGLRAQFRPGKDEADFARVNRVGMIEFKKAAVALRDVAEILSSSDPIKIFDAVGLLQTITATFTGIVEGNRALAQSLDVQQFRELTAYFGSVTVHGRHLRGVNAGDQPWSYIIDLLFGVNLKHVFETAFDRIYPAAIHTSAEAMRYELSTTSYLQASYLLPEDARSLDEVIRYVETGGGTLVELVEKYPGGDDKIKLRDALRSTMRSYIMTSNTHFGLAKKYVPADPNAAGEQIGSSGTNIDKFLLHGLIAERRRAEAVLE